MLESSVSFVQPRPSSRTIPSRDNSLSFNFLHSFSLIIVDHYCVWITNNFKSQSKNGANLKLISVFCQMSFFKLEPYTLRPSYLGTFITVLPEVARLIICSVFCGYAIVQPYSSGGEGCDEKVLDQFRARIGKVADIDGVDDRPVSCLNLTTSDPNSPSSPDQHAVSSRTIPLPNSRSDLTPSLPTSC